METKLDSQIVSDSSQSTAQGKNKRRSPIYSFFADIFNKAGVKESHMQCSYCTSKIFGKSSNLERHLKLNHQTEYERFLEIKPLEVPRRKAADDDIPARKKSRTTSCAKIQQNGSLINQDEVDEASGTDDPPEYDLHGVTIKQEYEENTDSEERLEFIGVSGHPPQTSRLSLSSYKRSLSISELVDEEKFIRVVYPEHREKSRLQLIDEIRLLQDKVKVYKGTIDKLLK